MSIKVTIAALPFSVEFEVGSLKEASAVLSADSTELAKQFDEKFLNGSAGIIDESGAADGAAQSQTVDSGQKPERKPRTPKNAATASAPAPAPIPAPAAPASDGLDIPDALKRTAAPAPAAAAPPPPPIMPPAAAPPVAPPAPTPPTSVHAAKIVAELQRRATGAADKGQGLADWLAGAGVITKGSNFDEALSVIPFTSDEKLTPLLQPLGLS